jgi:hypothetical protein
MVKTYTLTEAQISQIIVRAVDRVNDVTYTRPQAYQVKPADVVEFVKDWMQRTGFEPNRAELPLVNGSKQCTDCLRDIDPSIPGAELGDSWDGIDGPMYRCLDCFDAVETEGVGR